MARPKLPKRKVKKSVTLNDSIIKALTKIGGGNLSAGIESVYLKAMETEGKKAEKSIVD